MDQAWRTAGVRELVTIPLYLRALLSLPPQAPFPTTKEEILRHFVAAHEKEANHAEALHAVVEEFQQDYLEDLAVFTTRAANTAISDNNARRSIFETEAKLAKNGQITTKPQPSAVLDVLVSNHVLMRTGDVAGVSFQHQQFQEWYASHWVERRIIREVADPVGRDALKTEIFNLPAWEEAILFAVERLARGDAHQRAACAKCIVAAFEVDPILAAEMIFRSSEDVWAHIAATIQDLVNRWHTPKKVDRAFRFMLTSGRPEFFDAVWPLITDQNEQISLKALRNCKRFRPTILGIDAERKIIALPQGARKVLLSEIAWHSGIDGLDLASSIAKDDPDPELQASIVDALAFRHAYRHVELVLQNASDKTFDLIVRRGIVDKLDDEEIMNGIAGARKRLAAEPSSYDRLHDILYTQEEEDRSDELTAIISSIEIDKRHDTSVQLIYEAHDRYPGAVSEGLLARVLAGRTLFYGADDILASTELRLEDDALLQLALAETPRRDDRAEAAASVLGTQATGRMIDALLDAETRLRDANDKYDKSALDRYHDIQVRIAHVPGASLVAAIQARSAQANNELIASFAELLSRHPDGNTDHSRPFDTKDLATIRALAEDWGSRMLASGNAKRSQVLSIATLVSHVPDVSLLPLLKRLLDDNLKRYRAFRKEAEASAWRNRDAVDEAHWPMMHEYQRAFLAINAPETTELMREYLIDPNFGEFAAGVLSSHWLAMNEPPPDEQFFGSVDFRRVKEKRAKRAANPTATSAEAEAIFKVIEPLIREGATDNQKKHAIALGVEVARIPLGQHDATIEKLIALIPRRGRSKLLLNLILSGAEIDSKHVVDGLAETLEAAKTAPWMLTQSEGYELREWLQLLPFTDRPAAALEVVSNIPDAQRIPRLFEDLFRGLAETPSEGGESTLFNLAEENPGFYHNDLWRAATLKLGTATAAHRLIDLTVSGAFDGKSLDSWHWSQELGGLIAEFPEVRRHAYGLLKDGITSQGAALLARAVAESPDTKGLLLLVDIESKQKQPMISWRTIEYVVTEDIPVENWGGAYDVVPVPAIELRQKLLAMTTDGGPTDVAARYLRDIDVIRDEHGIPVSEPRHPDLSSGKPWPILTPDPYATAD